MDARRLEAELMDDPSLDDGAHLRALHALSRVHRLSATGRRLRSTLDRIAASGGPRSGGDDPTPIRVLDLACGGGDASLDAARWGRETGRAVQVTAFDASPVALEFVRRRAEGEGLAIETRVGRAPEELPDLEFDLVFSSLFLHHLENDVAVAVLRAAAARGRHVEIEDLRRTRLGLALTHLTLHTVARSRVAQVDGPRSVRAAFRVPEVRGLAEAAGLDGARIDTVWPQRWRLRWSRR